MTALGDILDTGQRIEGHRPWPRVVVDSAGWDSAAFLAADGVRAALEPLRGILALLLGI